MMSNRSPDLGDVLRELRAIRKLLEPRVWPLTLSKKDRVTLARLLPAVAAVFIDGELFTSRELGRPSSARSPRAARWPVHEADRPSAHARGW